MGLTLSILLSLVGLVVVLMFLSPFARRAAERLRTYPNTPLSLGVPVPPLTASRGALPPIAPEETARYHLGRLLSSGGVLGAVLIPPLVLLFPMNARILAEGFEVLMNAAPTLVITLSYGEWRWDITDFQIYGLTLALSLLFLTAAVAETFERRAPTRWLVLAIAASFVVFEVGLAAFRGYHLADDGEQAMLAAASGLQGLVSAAGEIAAGYFAIHAFLMPLILTVAWAAVAPVRGVSRFLSVRWRDREARPRIAVDPDRPGLMTRVLAAMDDAFFEPLRQLDEAVAPRLIRHSARRQPTGENA